MSPDFDLSLAEPYKSNSQRIRVLTENWCERELFCPCCGAEIKRYPNNTPLGDFYCTACHENFELKSSKSPFGRKIPAGTYSTAIDKIKSGEMPHFFFLHYIGTRVQNLITIPKQFFIPEIIEKRKPLKESARRAGWTGCNILIPEIPLNGIIPVIKESVPVDRQSVLEQFNKVRFLQNSVSKNWLIDVMKCIDMAGKEYFLLEEIYAFENFLHERHPENHYIKPKIRQQLQFLRNNGILEFCGRGKYRRI